MVHNICMVSDFFYPNMGGVESHIYQLSQCLIQLGHKVIIITHAYGDRIGIRYLTNGLKVYYLPFQPIYNQCILPTVIFTMPLIRNILIREEIQIVHGHSAFSTLAHEAMLHAKAMKLKTVFTDHSLFGFADISSILTNKILKVSLADCNHVICVSHTCKENTVLRGAINPHKVSVIPNAIDASQFTPDFSLKNSKKVTIVVISRLVYRKGTDLLSSILPIICNKYLNVDFIIGGDGPRRLSIEEVRENEKLQNRVHMLGNLHHDQVQGVLNKGDIFLNTSLTEAFCIAIVEAACCGLQVVTTKVGGIPEVLPPHLVYLAEPNVQNLVEKLDIAIKNHVAGNVLNIWDKHTQVAKLYTWKNVVKRTIVVYDRICQDKIDELSKRIKKYNHLGKVAAPFFMSVIIIHFLFLCFLEIIQPQKAIEIAPTLKPTKLK